MDSPESNKIVASSSSLDSPAVQESPFFNYLRTLSPIKSVKAAAHVAQGFSELNIPTPPPVFTSPRLNPHSETVFLKRSKFSQSSNAKLSIEHEDRGQTFGAGSDVSEQNIRRLTVGLAPCTQKACDTKDSLQIQLHSPSRFVDEYLADPIEVADVNPSDPSDSCLNQVVDGPETLESGHINSKETTIKDGDGDGNYIMKYMEVGSDAQIVSSGRTDESLQGESVVFVEPGKVKEGNGQHVEYPDLMSNKINDISLSDSSLEPVSGEQNVPNVENQAQGGQEGKRDNDAQVLPRILETGRHPVLSHESLANKTTDLEETGQNQRGSRRRCLQFEASAARRKFISSNCVLNTAITSHCSKAPANPTDLEMLESVHLNGVSSRSKHTVNSSQPISKTSPCLAKTQEANISKFDRSVRNGGNSSMKAPLPSGIGLHLNSIVNTASMSCSGPGSIISAENDLPSVQNEKSLSVMKLHISEEVKTSPMPATVVGKNSANHHENPQTQSLTAENLSTSQVPYGNADKYQDFNQPSPINKRKRAYTIEEEGCKRCNCRRSKCLKLYCECFAAGIYCAEPCACQECFNKPEYEDMVLGTRHQIESRNPLAFAPKIIRRVTDSPVNSGEDNNKVTPSSARHKRGCNCKKSMCLKKYCECYQSGVGCSNGCRCEGCKNTFGIKEGYGEISGIVSRKVNEESLEDLSVGKLAMETRNSVIIHSEHRHPHNLTPLTPSVQSSSNGKDVAKSRLPGRCLPSPESDSNGFSAYAQSPSSPGNLDVHDKQGRRAEGNLDIVFDQELEFSVTGKMDQFSPKWDRFEDLYNITPLAHAPPKAVANLSPSNSRDCAKVSRVQLQGSVRLSGSLRWRSSPIAPMPRLGGSKLRQEVDSDIGYDFQEDDTPDILKDTPSPVKTVKASSPNQKRISPPHGHLHSLTSSSSPGLRNGRKFVLQSISSFPSLTPYSDPKDSSSNG